MDDPCCQRAHATICTNAIDGTESPLSETNSSWRLWNYDPQSTSDILPGDPVAHGQWASIKAGHAFIPMNDGHVLDWSSST